MAIYSSREPWQQARRRSRDATTTPQLTGLKRFAIEVQLRAQPAIPE